MCPFLKESYEPVILRARQRRRARILQHGSDNCISKAQHHCFSQESGSTRRNTSLVEILDPATVLYRAITRPWRFLTRNPLLFIIGFFLAVSYTIIAYLLLDTNILFLNIFSTRMACFMSFWLPFPYSSKTRNVSLSYSIMPLTRWKADCPIWVLSLVSWLDLSFRLTYNLGYGRFWLNETGKVSRNTGCVPCSWVFSCFHYLLDGVSIESTDNQAGMILFPISLLIYGWSAFKQVHWVFPELGLTLFAIGTFIIFVSILWVRTYVNNNWWFYFIAIYPRYLIQGFSHREFSKRRICSIFSRGLYSLWCFSHRCRHLNAGHNGSRISTIRETAFYYTWVRLRLGRSLHVVLSFLLSYGYGSTLLALLALPAIPLSWVLYLKGTSLRSRWQFHP